MTKAKTPTDKKAKLGSTEIAALLKIDAKRLRQIIRENKAKATTEGRYEFKESDVPKLRELVEEHTRKEEQVKAAKKAAKK
jgi:phage antirepressor YoqD-like protein